MFVDFQRTVKVKMGKVRKGGVRKGRRGRRRRKKKMKMTNQNTISLISYLQNCCTSTRLAARLLGGSRNYRELLLGHQVNAFPVCRFRSCQLVAKILNCAVDRQCRIESPMLETVKEVMLQRIHDKA